MSDGDHIQILRSIYADETDVLSARLIASLDDEWDDDGRRWELRLFRAEDGRYVGAARQRYGDEPWFESEFLFVGRCQGVDDLRNFFDDAGVPLAVTDALLRSAQL